jgi:glutamyl-tRNA reductase
VLVTNRTFERAEALSASLGGQAVPFERMEESLVLADMVVCTTASPRRSSPARRWPGC